jgi:hypothetical protein
MKYLKKFNEEVSFSNIFGRSRMADAKTIQAPETSLYFSIDREPYEKSQFNQAKYKVYLTKNGVTYYIGDIRRFDSNSNPISYLRLDNMTKVESFPKNVSGLNNEEMKIVNDELDRQVITSDLMDEPITYREKIESLNEGVELTLFQLISAWMLYNNYKKYGFKGMFKYMGNNLKDWMENFIEFSTTMYGSPVTKDMTEYEFKRLLDRFKKSEESKNESWLFENSDEYLKSDLEDALQTFDVILNVLNDNHPNIKKDSVEFDDFIKHNLNVYQSNSSRKSIKNLLNRI